MNNIITNFYLWPALMVVALIAIIYIGIHQYFFTPNGELRRRYKDRLLVVASAVFSLPIWIMLIVESNGVYNFFDSLYSGAGPDSSGAAMFTCSFAGILFFAILTSIGKIAAWAALGSLTENTDSICDASPDEKEIM